MAYQAAEHDFCIYHSAGFRQLTLVLELGQAAKAKQQSSERE